jgi:L-lactate utilization protein LutB
MDINRVKRNNLLAEKVIKGLESRNMEGYYVQTKEEALAKALEIIPEGATISWGGTMSAREIGLEEAVLGGNYTVYNRDAAKNPEEKHAAEIAALEADFYLASTNAITEDGVLVNIDGFANRVACIAYGPKTVLMIVGMNKIVRDVDAAISRS